MQGWKNECNFDLNETTKSSKSKTNIEEINDSRSCGAHIAKRR